MKQLTSKLRLMATAMLANLALPGTVLASDWTEGFDGNLNNWLLQSGNMMTYSTAVNHGTYTGAGVAQPNLTTGEMYRFTGAGSRPYHAGKVTGCFYDAQRYMPGACGNTYQQMLQFDSPLGGAFQWGVGFRSASGGGDYYKHDSGTSYTSIGTRGNPGVCSSPGWVAFVVEFTADGNCFRSAADGIVTRTDTEARPSAVINAGIGRVRIGFGGFSANQGYWDDISWTGYACGQPTGIAATPQSTSSILWTASAATDNNQFGFALMDGTTEKVVSPTNVRQSSASLTESGLSANTAYTRAIRAWNGDNNSANSSTLTKYTLSVAPTSSTVTPDNSFACLPNSAVIWTAVGGFGAGTLAKYKYAWDQSATHVWTGSESDWNSGSLSTTPSAAGSWYLHVKGYNGDNVANGTFDYKVAVVQGAVKWTGGSGNWDFSTTGLWQDGAPNAVKYCDSHDVVFDDGASSAPTITLNTTVAPMTVTNNSTKNYTIAGSGVISGTGTTLTKQGSSTLVLGGSSANTYSGLTRVSAGTLSLGKGTAGLNAFGGDLTIDGGTVNYSSARDNQIPDTANVTLSSGTLDFGVRSEMIGGASAGSFTMNGGSLLKAGTGTVQFSRNPRITAGTITHSAASTPIQFNQELILDGGTIDFSSISPSSTAAVNLRGGDGTGITYESSGTATASITYSGAAGGGAGASLSLNTSASSTTVFTIADAPSVDPELDIAVAITGSSALQKSGAGTMRLSGGSANTYNGLTTVTGGILALNKTPGMNAIPAALTITGGAVRLDAANQIANSSAVTVSGGALNLQANDDTVTTVTLSDGSISGTGGTLTATASAFDMRKGSVTAKLGGFVGLSKTTADTVTLGGANTYCGITTISAGTLALAGSGSIANSPTNTVASGATFDVSAVTGGFHLTSGQTLTGTGTNLGPVTVDSGATLAPGAGVTLGTLTVSNNLTLSGSANLRINKSGSTLTSDHIAGISTLIEGGTLTVTKTGDDLQIGDSFTLFSAMNCSGEFAAISPAKPNNDTELAWDAPALKTFGLLRVHHVPYATNKTIVRAKGMSAKVKLGELFPSTDPLDSDAVVLERFTGGSQGATITSNATYIFYLPANANNDSFDYTVKDSRGERRTRTIMICLTNSVGSVNITNSGAGQMTVSFAGIPGYDYVVQRSSNLVDWVFLVTNTAPTNGLDIGRIRYTETPPHNPAYYRGWRP